ncbi:hypothetical protein D5086_006241 [Populus alba]|uniref:Uncharacterized protein n=1 Tax=Populus alba TaxID=43335 RepID=A0ACC4CM58_POPAL
MWYFSAILYFGKYYNKDPRERSGLAACAIAVSKKLSGNWKVLHLGRDQRFNVTVPTIVLIDAPRRYNVHSGCGDHFARLFVVILASTISSCGCSVMGQQEKNWKAR